MQSKYKIRISDDLADFVRGTHPDLKRNRILSDVQSNLRNFPPKSRPFADIESWVCWNTADSEMRHNQTILPHLGGHACVS